MFLSQLTAKLLPKAVGLRQGRHLEGVAERLAQNGLHLQSNRLFNRSATISCKGGEGGSNKKHQGDIFSSKKEPFGPNVTNSEFSRPQGLAGASQGPKVTTLVGDPVKVPKAHILYSEEPPDDGVAVKLVNNPSASNPTDSNPGSKEPIQPKSPETSEGYYSCPEERKQISGNWKTNAVVIDKGTKVINSKRIPIPDLSIQDFIWNNCESFIHQNMATCSLTGRHYSYFMVQQASLCLAAGLRIKASILRKSIVAVVLPHVPEFLIVYFGVITAGMTVVPVNPLKSRQELFSDLSIIRPSVVICASPSFHDIGSVVTEVSQTGKNILLIPMSNNDYDENGEVTTKHPTSIHDLILEGSTLELPEDCQLNKPKLVPADDEDDIAFLPYVTSAGSTVLSEPEENRNKEDAGFPLLEDDELPKGMMQKDICGCFKPGDPRVAMLTHRNVVSCLVAHLENGLQLHSSKDPSSKSRETVLSLVPMSHYYGSHMGLILTSRYGGQLIMMPLFAPDFFISTMVKHRQVIFLLKSMNVVKDVVFFLNRPTVLLVIPTLLDLLIKDKAIKASHLASVKLIICAIEKLPADLLQRFKAKFKKGIIFKQNYAMLEAGIVCSTVNKFIDTFDSSSLGGPVANMEYRVFSSRRNEPIAWPNNEYAGRIEVRGPQVMDHYWNCNHPHDCKFFNKGWYKTGDIGFFNAYGELYLVERFKDSFVIDGVDLDPKKLEGILKTHRSIQDAAILEIYVPNIGFLPHGFIVLKSRKLKEQTTLSEINKYVGNIVSVPNPLRAGMHIVERIPRRSDGRVDMAELKQLYYNTHVETRMKEGTVKPEAINTI